MMFKEERMFRHEVIEFDLIGRAKLAKVWKKMMERQKELEYARFRFRQVNEQGNTLTNDELLKEF